MAKSSLSYNADSRKTCLIYRRCRLGRLLLKFMHCAMLQLKVPSLSFVHDAILLSPTRSFDVESSSFASPGYLGVGSRI